MGDGAGTANRRFAVAAADWESVGGAGTPMSEGRTAERIEIVKATNQSDRDRHKKNMKNMGSEDQRIPRLGRGKLTDDRSDRPEGRFAGDKPESDTRCNARGR